MCLVRECYRKGIIYLPSACKATTSMLKLSVEKFCSRKNKIVSANLSWRYRLDLRDCMAREMVYKRYVECYSRLKHDQVTHDLLLADLLYPE